MTHHFNDKKEDDFGFRIGSKEPAKKEEQGQKQETVQVEKREGQKKETKKGVKESDFKGKDNLNKVGIKGASDLNAIDTLDTTFANIASGQELKVDLAEEYENIKALKVKFVSNRGPFKFKVNDSDKEFESKALKDEAEIFELDESTEGNCVCIKPTGDNGAEIVSVQVFVEGDPNKRKSHVDRNPPAPKTTKKNGDKK